MIYFTLLYALLHEISCFEIDSKNRMRAVTGAARELPDTTHRKGLGRPRPHKREGANRVGHDRTNVPIHTASTEEPTAEVLLALNPRSTHWPADDPSVSGRPETAGLPGAPPASSPHASDPHRQKGQRRISTRTGRKWTEREAGEQPSTGPRTSPPPDGDRSPTHRAGGARKRRRDGETRCPLERKLATREGFTRDSGRVACEQVLCFVAEVLEVAKERGSTETSKDLSRPSS